MKLIGEKDSVRHILDEDSNTEVIFVFRDRFALSVKLYSEKMVKELAEEFRWGRVVIHGEQESLVVDTEGLDHLIVRRVDE